MGPIDYTMQVLDPIEAMLSGYAQRLGQENTERQMGQQDVALNQGQQRIDLAQQAQAMEMQAAQAEADRIKRAEEGQRAFADFILDPVKTYDKVVAVAQAYPDIAQGALELYEGQNEAQRENTLQFGKQFAFALGQGNSDVALKMAEDRATAEENAGNAEGAATYRAMAEYIKDGPEGVEVAKGLALSSLSGVLKPEELKTFMETAGYGVADLADQKTAAEIEKIKAETEKTRAELANPPGGEDNFDREKKLRDEYVKLTGDYTTVRDAYRRVGAAEDSAAGDLSLIFSYMKMLDPASVVREAEFANAQNAAGVPERIRNMYNKALTGERLGENQRTEFKVQAAGLMKAAGLREAEVRKGLEPSIKQYGLSAENIFSVGGQAEDAPADGQSDDAFIAEMKAKRGRGEPLTAEEAARVRKIMGGQ